MGRRPPRGSPLKIRLASIGKDRSGLFQPAVDEYSKRLTHYTRFSLVELPEAKVKKGSAPGVSKALEAEALLGLKAPQDWLIALDERGKELDSPELAKFIQKAQLSSKDLLFVIGGDEGLDPRVRESAQLVLSLSRLTLPHRMARMMLVEQLYRAHTILRGEPYHK